MSFFFQTTSLLGLISLLAGCEIFDKKEKPPLEGKRIPVAFGDSSLRSDVTLVPKQIDLPAAVSVSAWEQSGFNAAHTTPHVRFSKKLKAVGSFSFGTGRSEDGRMLSAPILTGGVLYGVDAQTRLRAFSTKTREMLWEVDLSPENKAGEYALGGGVAYGKGALFATTAYGDLISLDAKTGKEHWKKPLGSPCRAAPIFQDGQVYVMTVDNQLHVFQDKTGELLWSHAGIAENLGLLGTSLPAVLGDTVVVAYSSGEVFGLKAGSGTVMWSESVSASKKGDLASSLTHVQALPVIDGNTVYILNQDGRMAALHVQNGRRLWERDIAGIQTPVVAGDSLFLLSQQNELICLDKAYGHVHWVKKLPEPQGFEGKNAWAGPLAVEGNLYVVGIQGVMLAISPQTGEIQKSYPLPHGASLPPIVTSQGFYVLTEDGTLTVFEPAL
ncbi:MAG: PQQ-binding-like beta-propeller repeat protein [Alphaproteobacteria bacterium]